VICVASAAAIRTKHHAEKNRLADGSGEKVSFRRVDPARSTLFVYQLRVPLDDAPTAERIFLDHQNRFRGLVAAFKSKEFVKKRASTPARSFRSGYRRLMLEARLALSEDQFGPFHEWVAHQLETQLPDLARTPVGFDELAGIVTANATTLPRELRWVAHRLKNEVRKLSTFRALVQLVEVMVIHGDHEAAIAALSTVEDGLGVSLWGVQLRIALEQFAGGLERQKRYTTSVRAVYRQGLLGFVAYHTSVRNEDKTTPGKFADHILTRIDRHALYTEDVKSYLKYRLAGRWPEGSSELAWILQIEQSHHLFDLYETFIACAQEIVREDRYAENREVLRECISMLPVNLDFRLSKIESILVGAPTSLPKRCRDISDPLFTGKLIEAARGLASAQRDSVIDIWDVIYGGVALSFASHGHPPDAPQARHAAKLLAVALSDQTAGQEAWDQLGKLAANLRGLPFGSALGDAINVLARSHPTAAWRPWIVGLNSAVSGIEDIPPSAQAVQVSGPTEEAWRTLGSPIMAPTGNVAADIISGIGLLSSGQEAKAKQVLEPIHQAAAQSPFYGLVTNLLLHARFATGDYAGSIELVADAATVRPGQRGMIPVRATLEGLPFADYRDTIAPLAAPIALHMLWLDTEKDITRSQLRFATGAALKKCGVDRPSAMCGCSDLPQHQLIYFLSEVCKTDVLDILRSMKSTRATLEERRAILHLLQELGSEAAYSDELMEVARDLTMADGQWIVDHTRIHVDTAALFRWADRELQEDFARYYDLAAVDIGPQPSFDDVLKELTTVASSKTFAPDNEADAVLQSMVRRLADEFLTSGVFGLDFYLSKRIRHQSFIGRIRGPLEFSHLITTRETESSPYHRNTYWLERFSSSTPEQKDAINAALEGCASDFDEILRDAKDRLFHIRSVDKPDGLLNLVISSQLLQLVKTVAQWTPDDFALFCEVAVSAFWGALEASLARVRTFISTELKTQITQRLERARAEVRAVAANDPNYHDFDIQFGTRSTEVQRALDDAASWFTFTQIERFKRTFTLEEAVRIGRDNALRSQRAFAPVIETEVQGGVEITAPGLVIIHDTLFIALDNIRTHSGERSPHVDIQVSHCRDQGTLTVEVISDCKPQKRQKAEASLREIQGIIDGGTPTRRTKKEGGSGLLKLNAVVGQSSKGKLDAGFEQGGRFRLAVTYSFTYEAPLTEQAAA
jgi:hypothetical protein